MPVIAVDSIAAALRHCAEGDAEAARTKVEAIRTSQLPRGPRARMTDAVVFDVYRREQFTCRYCGQQTVLLAALRYLSGRFPDLVPYHPNWRRDATHPLYPLITTSLDHLVPVRRGGTNEPTNLFTTCSRCNYQKGDLLLEELGWQVLPPSTVRWDGLTGFFLRAMAAHPLPELMNDVARLKALGAGMSWAT
jgi:5-methylcytosine-specific restriction endonuclease McrA